MRLQNGQTKRQKEKGEHRKASEGIYKRQKAKGEHGEASEGICKGLNVCSRLWRRRQSTARLQKEYTKDIRRESMARLQKDRKRRQSTIRHQREFVRG